VREPAAGEWRGTPWRVTYSLLWIDVMVFVMIVVGFDDFHAMVVGLVVDGNSTKEFEGRK
jgi:hypothetical protein